MQIKMSDQGLSDQDLYNWVQWMVSQLPTRPGKSIALLDLSNNSITSVGAPLTKPDAADGSHGPFLEGFSQL